MKRIIAIALVCACVLLVCTSCKKGEEYPEKDAYNVTMKVVIEGIGEYIFPPDVKEMTVTIPYDGVSRKVYLSAYQYYDHPNKTFRESWFEPPFEGRDVFKEGMLYEPPGGLIKSKEENIIDEEGVYAYTCYVSTTSQSMEFRFIALHIVVEENRR